MSQIEYRRRLAKRAAPGTRTFYPSASAGAPDPDSVPVPAPALTVAPIVPPQANPSEQPAPVQAPDMAETYKNVPQKAAAPSAETPKPVLSPIAKPMDDESPVGDAAE